MDYVGGVMPPFKRRDDPKEYDRQFYLENREKILARVRLYHAANKDKSRDYRRKNRVERNLYLKKWRKDNPEKTKAKRKRHYWKYRSREIGKARAWYKANRERALMTWKMKRYRLTERQVLRLLKSPCEICGGTATKIDHDHQTGLVRGGLCTKCNSGIGMLGDNIRGLRLAIAYLKRKRP
jgi:hypothetical protein